ncbi:MAG: hypothetical protein A2Z07_07470 [Armatimonadetes bacterium RBG_16_67_12]|nr:MAG: hypothetical protein A2Z07_07470 [Armatimonadetes bacterium RBG_16_67_12]
MKGSDWRAAAFGLGVAVVMLPVVTGIAAPPEAAAYFPMSPGTVWVYRTTGREITMRAAGSVRVGASQCRMIETVIDGTVTQSECIRVAGDGVYVHLRSYAAGSVALDPPQRLLAFPVVVGRKWQWTGRIGERSVVFDYAWARRETTVTPAGTFDAMQLYFAGAPDAQTHVQSWRWYARGVGMVKEDTVLAQGNQTVRVYAELVRMVPGK